jgi:hypothetical protein
MREINPFNVQRNLHNAYMMSRELVMYNREIE